MAMPAFLFLLLSLPLFFYGRLQVDACRGKMQMWVKNWLSETLYVKVKNSQGITTDPVMLIVKSDEKVKSLLLANNSVSYETQRPWFMWLRIRAATRIPAQFEWRVFGFLVEDPHYGTNRTMGCGCHWEIHGNGIFLALTDHKADTLVRTQFCSWDRSSVPHLPLHGVEPMEYRIKGPVPPCSSYTTSWMEDPVWISVSHKLVNDVEVKVKKGSGTSVVIHLDGNGKQGQNTPRKYERILSVNRMESRNHVWAIVVRVQDDLSRKFDVTLHNPLGVESGIPVIGCILKLYKLFIWVVQVDDNWQKGDAKAVCSWYEEDSRAGVPYCGHGDGFSI